MMAKQRVVIVTGGGTGIGLAMAKKFCKAGDKVIIVGRREGVLNKAVQQLIKDGDDADSICADLTKPQDVTKLTQEISRRKIKNVDVLINNAGGLIQPKGKDLQSVARQYTENFEVNTLSAVLTTEALKDHITKGGRIINLSSIAALRGGGSAYSAAKAAIIGWSFALANEMSMYKTTVNVIAPGYVPDTEFFGDTMTKKRHDWLVSMTPLQRAGTPNDVAEMAFFLASDKASFITGQVMQVNGGALMR
jgi:3-oxoacyl-[acyl-carrier protein] reductase